MTAFDGVIARYAVGEFDDTTPLRAVGLESLSVLRIVADLLTDPEAQVWPERLATVWTVGDLKAWLGELTGAQA
jgi:hypothetical protein